MSAVAACVVVTGANGFVGSGNCGALLARVARVRAVVRRAGTAPELPGVAEVVGDVTDDASDYAVTKRDTDGALADVDGITRVLLRRPAILGPGPTSTWNTLRPAAMGDDDQPRRAVASQTFARVHVAALASLTADLAVGRVPDAADPTGGPVAWACVALNVAAGCANQRDYFAAVTGALRVDPVREHAPSWTGRLLAQRAHGWGWRPTMELARALNEIAVGRHTVKARGITVRRRCSLSVPARLRRRDR